MRTTKGDIEKALSEMLGTSVEAELIASEENAPESTDQIQSITEEEEVDPAEFREAMGARRALIVLEAFPVLWHCDEETGK